MTLKEDAADLLERYVTALDERRFEEWLALFADDGYYAMLLHKDYAQGTNMLGIGEDRKRLAGRFEVGQGVERDLTTHLLSAVRAHELRGVVHAEANFAVIRRNALLCNGRYHMELVRAGGALKIRRCSAVLRNDVIEGTLYLPV